MVGSNSSTSGSARDALAPKVSKRAPAGLTLDTSHVGILPAYSSDINSLYAVAQPSLLSSTIILQTPDVSVGILGKLFTYFCSTENPTPVPHSRMNRTSSKHLM